MATRNLPIPTVAAIAVTRGLLGFGAGLLIAQRVPSRRRRILGWTLLGVGAASTVPLAVSVFRARAA
jgi:hypothetical protein